MEAQEQERKAAEETPRLVPENEEDRGTQKLEERMDRLTTLVEGLIGSQGAVASQAAARGPEISKPKTAVLVGSSQRAEPHIPAKISTRSSASRATNVDYAEYAGMKPADLHRIFQSKLNLVAVKKKGDTNFGSLYSSWNQLLKQYPVSESAQHQLLGYGFSGVAAKVFLNVQSDARNVHCSPSEPWKIMAQKLYNSEMVQAQRANFTSTVLGPEETVADLADRLQELAVGLAEIDGDAGDEVLSQRLIDALPEELQIHAFSLGGDFDSKVSALNRIQSKKKKIGASWRHRRERVNQMDESGADKCASSLSDNELVQAVEEFQRRRGEEARRSGYRGSSGQQRGAHDDIQGLTIDTSQPLGSRHNPVGPDPDFPDRRQFYSTTRQCYGCHRYGHTRTSPDNTVICKWKPLNSENGAGRDGRKDNLGRN